MKFLVRYYNNKKYSNNLTFQSIILGFFLLLLIFNPVFTNISADIPEFLQEGSYAQYKQKFSTGETYELYWEITQINSTIAIINIRSHGIQFNSTSNEITISPGGGVMHINRENWIIKRFFLSNGTEIIGHPTGKKIALWISTSVNKSVAIYNMYDQNVYPRSVGPLHFDCLPAPRKCWLTENYYSTSKSMKRWYDKKTGIVLKIETNLKFDTSEINILESLNTTNISALMNDQSNKDTIISFGLTLLFGIMVLYMIYFIFYFKKNKQM